MSLPELWHLLNDAGLIELLSSNEITLEETYKVIEELCVRDDARDEMETL